jgi:hypothetical protein
MVMSPNDFQRELESYMRKKLKLTINDNRSTMLSVKWEPDCTKVSLHRIFLHAPENVMQSLACYIDKRHRSIAVPVKTFISEKLKTLDYSHKLQNFPLEQCGQVHHLGKLYNAINYEYFGNRLNLNITWYGDYKNNNKRTVTCGQYCNRLKLIKISRVLDKVHIPDYVISYIIYHEMLHHVCPPYVDDKGINRIHNPEFKSREKVFREFKRAKLWFKSHKKALFFE